MRGFVRNILGQVGLVDVVILPFTLVRPCVATLGGPCVATLVLHWTGRFVTS